ncbi:MAG: AbrB/MazE/SpoVT family DNA-binding domain-containing protein [Chlamydiae bacterium]|nr:AbrB/MazE/SpoVT family DNA-binding domain-containing protein [Chlamydiota bacterium]MBI3277718.1 AbrB/MazE/SpoVT family DNA-binding domain-containing protein [Chlamydiota bacterium]
MEASVVTLKGQIVIPAKLRKLVGIRQGTKVFFEEKDGDIIVHPATPHFYERTCGILKGGHLVKTLEESRRKEKEREKSKFEKF